MTKHGWLRPVMLLMAAGALFTSGGCCERCNMQNGECPVGTPEGNLEAYINGSRESATGEGAQPTSTTIDVEPAAPASGASGDIRGGAPVAGADGVYARAADIPNFGRRETALTGNVVFFEGGMAIGGEAPPSGFTLRTDQYRHLYLRQHGQLEAAAVRALEGELVRVKGRVGAIRVGGVETPLRFYPVLEIDTIERVGHRAP